MELDELVLVGVLEVAVEVVLLVELVVGVVLELELEQSREASWLTVAAP